MRCLDRTHGVYLYEGHVLTFMFVADGDGRWEVYEDERFLGILLESTIGEYRRYTARLTVDGGQRRRLVITEDWRSAVVYLVESV